MLRAARHALAGLLSVLQTNLGRAQADLAAAARNTLGPPPAVAVAGVERLPNFAEVVLVSNNCGADVR